MVSLGTLWLTTSATIATALLIGCDTGASGTDGGNPPGCPAEAPVRSLVTCNLPADQKCQYVQACNSGEVGFEFICRLGRFEAVMVPCAMPYDSCAGTSLQCDEVWFLVDLPPPDGRSPCPTERPVDGSPCDLYSMPKCGYACNPDAATGWTIVECSGGDTGYTWQSDGACEAMPQP